MTRTETHHEAQERRARESYGYRPSNARICPLVVAGKRCVADSDSELCVCQRHHHLLDHGRIWLDADGAHVLTGEPYDVGGGDLADFIAAMTGLGLDVRLSGRSPWNPGHTLLITISRPPIPREVIT